MQKIICLITVLLFIGGCSLIPDMPVCGDGLCGLGESDICPEDCENVEPTCTGVGGYVCADDEYCNSGRIDGFDGCCTEPCSADQLLELKEGMITFSVPSVAYQGEIEDSLGEYIEYIDNIYSYTSPDGWKVWHSDPSIPSDLTMLEAGKGYIMELNEDISINFSDIQKKQRINTVPASLNLEEGWNLVGLTSDKRVNKNSAFNSIKHSSVVGYKDSKYTELDDEDMLEPGQAYWVYIEEDGTLR